MGKTRKVDEMVRINILLPPEERADFDRWCRFGTGSDKKVSMNRRLRQLMKADSAGKISLSRDAEPKTMEKP